MEKCNRQHNEDQTHFTARVPLVALGSKIHQMKLFEPIENKVHIHQKILKYRPVDKLKDGFIALLCGAQGMKDINKQVRPEPALQKAFGRQGCAEQSVVQDTLNACSAQNVMEMKCALRQIFQLHSQAFRHDYRNHYQILDVDLTGRPCGKKAALATKGYFSHSRYRRGRQEGYVVATLYEEIVTAEVYAGNTPLNQVFQALVMEAEACLKLDRVKCERTLLRVDAGGGSVDDINWALERGYHFHGKQYGSLRLRQLAASVTDWYPDPLDPGREVGWVKMPTDEFVRPVVRVAVRCRRANGQWGVGILVSTLAPTEVLWLTGADDPNISEDQDILLAYVRFYDQRGGGIEIEIKEDKQGLSTTKRTKKRAEAQQMLTQLEVLAHNTLVWVRRWLTPYCPKLARLGIKRWIREVLTMNGKVFYDQHKQLRELILNIADPLSASLLPGLAAILA
jgi:hypothetical protein